MRDKIRFTLPDRYFLIKSICCWWIASGFNGTELAYIINKKLNSLIELYWFTFDWDCCCWGVGILGRSFWAEFPFKNRVNVDNESPWETEEELNKTWKENVQTGLFFMIIFHWITKYSTYNRIWITFLPWSWLRIIGLWFFIHCHI